jgi:hypothetical protein
LSPQRLRPCEPKKGKGDTDNDAAEGCEWFHTLHFERKVRQMQGIDRFRATQREPKKETQRRKDARTQREEKRKEKREKIGMEMSKEEHSRHPRCGHLATRLKLHPEPTNDSSRTPHPLSHTLFPTLPYPTLLHLPFASLRLCVFAFNSFCLPALPRRMSFANGSHSGKG